MQQPPKKISQEKPKDTVKGSLRIFSSYKVYKDFYDLIDIEDRRVHTMPETYLDIYNKTIAQAQDIIDGRVIGTPPSTWYGEQYPESVDELLSRDEYPLMNEFNKVYEEKIKPRVEELQKDSKAALEIPTLKYNDIGLGTFDFARASIGLLPLYKYYSIKHKKYVEGVETYVKKVGKVFKTFLKSDDSPVVIVPQLKDGYSEPDAFKCFEEIYKGKDTFEALKKYGLKIGKFSSTIKKTYLYKENIPKPINAVRIFIYIGGNSDVTAEEFKWTGYTGIGIAQLLTSLGYNVSVHAIFGIGNGAINIGGSFEKGVRATAVTLKGFSETIHSQRLLYLASDPSFFRGKEFINIIKKSQFYNDYIDDGLGYSVGTNDIKSLTYKTFGSIDKLYNKDGTYNMQSGMLYYVVANVKSEAEMNQTIRDIGLSVINENKEARDLLYQQTNR